MSAESTGKPLQQITKHISDLSHRWPGVGQTQVHQFLDNGGTGAHDGIGGAPIEFERAVVFGDGGAGKDHVMDIADQFPRVFGRQNPAV